MGSGVDKDAVVKVGVEGVNFRLVESGAWWALEGVGGHIYWQEG
jgi:hypothetical protein